MNILFKIKYVNKQMNPKGANCNDLGNNEYRKLCISLSHKSIASNNPLPSSISGNKNADRLILHRVSDQDLRNFCTINKYVYGLCQEDSFWGNRITTKFGKYLGSLEEIREKYLGDTTWKEYYFWLMSGLLGNLAKVLESSVANNRDDLTTLITNSINVSYEFVKAVENNNL
ncbi:unnamed protein product, partial [marine sediment metagenome]